MTSGDLPSSSSRETSGNRSGWGKEGEEVPNLRKPFSWGVNPGGRKRGWGRGGVEGDDREEGGS